MLTVSLDLALKTPVQGHSTIFQPSENVRKTDFSEAVSTIAVSSIGAVVFESGTPEASAL